MRNTAPVVIISMFLMTLTPVKAHSMTVKEFINALEDDNRKEKYEYYFDGVLDVTMNLGVNGKAICIPNPM